jgi:hypothetical protein
MKQYMLTTTAGKRLIGKAMAIHPEVKRTLSKGTVLIVAGTTNGYVAEEILTNIGQAGNFSRKRFFRGITLPPSYKTTESGRLTDESKFPGDVFIKDGVLQPGKTIYDVASSLKEGDILIKGANALDVLHKRAAVYIGNPEGGTILLALQASVGRRVRLILPVGLEKRIPGDLDSLVNRVNSPGAQGARLLPVPGEVVTELDAITMLTGVTAEMVAGGGICGAEGCIFLAVYGTPEQEAKAEKVLQSIAGEPAFVI